MMVSHNQKTDNSFVRLLVVDDEPLNNDFVRRALRSQKDKQLITAESAEDALKVVERDQIDLVITDYSMPGMSGVDLINKARQVSPGILGMLLTAFPDIEAVVEARKQGSVMKILVKPIEAADLIGAVEWAVQIKRLRAAREMLQRKRL